MGFHLCFDLVAFFTELVNFLLQGSDLVRLDSLSSAKLFVVQLLGGKFSCEASVVPGQSVKLFGKIFSSGFSNNSGGLDKRCGLALSVAALLGSGGS